MREPRFWARDVDPKSREAAPLLRFLLSPVAWAYATATRRKIARATPHNVHASVICIGNLTAGGVGKSTVVAALRAQIQTTYSVRVAPLSRGYKGKLSGPLQVDPETHTASDVGDEPLMLSASGEAWIGADRAAAGRAMSDAGGDVILMDDGHQNPGLAKDLSLIVVDSAMGFGNGFVIPKGPLREPVLEGLARADAIIVLGDANPPAILHDSDRPIFKGKVVPASAPPPGAYVAFAGIGRPEKFFDTLNALDVDVRDAVPFPDHHTFSVGDYRYLRQLAADHDARLITTEKDLARLQQSERADIATLPIRIQIERFEALDKMIANVIKPSGHESD